MQLSFKNEVYALGTFVDFTVDPPSTENMMVYSEENKW